MNKLHKAIAIAALFVGMLGLSACDVQEASHDNAPGLAVFDEFVYHHSQGFSMNCMKQDRGLTCDWANKWPTNK